MRLGFEGRDRVLFFRPPPPADERQVGGDGDARSVDGSASSVVHSVVGLDAGAGGGGAPDPLGEPSGPAFGAPVGRASQLDT